MKNWFGNELDLKSITNQPNKEDTGLAFAAGQIICLEKNIWNFKEFRLF